MKSKHCGILLIVLLIIFIYNKIFITVFININNKFKVENLSNLETVNPQKLYLKTWKVIYNEYYDKTYNNQNWLYWQKRYLSKINNNDDVKIAIDTMTSSLNDPYTKFMEKNEFMELKTSISSKICGIGVHIQSKSGNIEIFNVLPQTPADLSQLKQGDIIVAIDGKDIKGLNIAQVASLVRGPENSLVELVILRNNKKIVKKIKRKEIKIKSVKSSILDGHIGYINILTFLSNNMPSEFIEALNNTQNCDSYIIDLRGNTGGLLDNAVFVADIFLQGGKIVDIIYKNGIKKTVKAYKNDLYINKPLIIIVNSMSASASEIVSGALKDNNRAKLVGQQTFGKGLVQKVIPLPNSSGLNLTVAKYLTPNGIDINKHGIQPDYVINNNVEFNLSNIRNYDDMQLNKAIEILNNETRIAKIEK